MSKFEVIETKGIDTFNYGFNNLADAIAYADRDWERLTYLEQSEEYEEFYILICADPDEDSTNRFNGDVFKDYKVDAELMAIDISDDHTRVLITRSGDNITIVDSIKDFIEFRDNIYMSELGAGYPFKDDIKFQFIHEREEPEKAEPVIDYDSLIFELKLIKRAFISIMQRYGLEHFTVSVSKGDKQYAIAGLAKDDAVECIDLDNEKYIKHDLKAFFDDVERRSNHE